METIAKFFLNHRTATIRVLVIVLTIPAAIWSMCKALVDTFIEAYEVFKDPDTL